MSRLKVSLVLTTALACGTAAGCVIDLFRKGDGGHTVDVAPHTSADISVPLTHGG